MAAKKVYAVRKGKITGIFHSWDKCRASVDGCPGAEYKGFTSMEEAERYLGTAAETAEAGGELPEPGTLLTYVDGSYDDSLKKYAFGCVFILPDGRVYTEYGNGDNEQSLQHRNVTGEMLGAMYAVRTAMLSGFQKVELRYDYEGIEKWVTGAWRSKTELTMKYAQSMRQWGNSIEISFTKVPAHSNVYYNEMADKTAKAGLREGAGIPKVRRVEELRPSEGKSI
ncbi:ribonuclease H family protein [Acetatifactor muris]|uniref:Ribonuclease H n=1 Tax=Acetatifactor muris TaxID=879566 RepID=A0A2K4ZEM4_9FIRM|nr:ribonuclease H family protein [Acetatifactor muris]MCR2048516.1 ribonuclease H family protein [Acetatifactor muris]SOY28908.1 Caulimovirus viroplasmin [Acetatifactor muris]